MKRFLHRPAVSIGLAGAALGFAVRVSSAPWPDEPLRADSPGTSPTHFRPCGGGSALTVDTRDLADVVRFFQSVYQVSAGVELGWNGDTANCVPGATSPAYLDATLLRVNYFRAMAGLPGDITFNDAHNQKCQTAALMMSAQGMLSHYPAFTWTCYTADGADAAGHSNLTLGSAGPDAVDGYMDDAGGANYAVGHRRWVLYPNQVEMGAGSVPGILDTDGSVLYEAANALWVVSDPPPPPRANAPEYIAWPPAGYVPYQVLPLASGRWSLSWAAADFSGAGVVMTCGGTNVSAVREIVEDGYADNTLVWRPQLPAAAKLIGATCQVVVTNIVAGGRARAVTYAVTIIDPQSVAILLTVKPLSGRDFELSWPAGSLSFSLYEADILGSGTNWTPALEVAPVLTNGVYRAAVRAEKPQRFYRLEGR
jgi:hypothetical protein